MKFKNSKDVYEINEIDKVLTICQVYEIDGICEIIDTYKVNECLLAGPLCTKIHDCQLGSVHSRSLFSGRRSECRRECSESSERYVGCEIHR